MSDMLLPAPGKPPGAIHHWDAHRGITRHLFVGAIAFCIIVFGLGGMAATFDIAGAIVTQGRLVVDTSVKKIQHPQGGTVSEIDVKDGDHVKAGDLLMKLDPTLAAANLGIIVKGYNDGLAQKARLLAEQGDADQITFPDELLAQQNDPNVKELITIETNLFNSRREARAGQKDQLNKKIAELNQQIVGIRAQQDSVRRMIKFTADELESLRDLAKRQLVPNDRMAGTEREAAQLDGQLGELVANEAQAGAEIAQAQLQILQVDQDMHSEVGRDLGDTESKLDELAEKKIAADDQLKKLDVRAPSDGVVYEMQVHTIGGVVGPGEPIMSVVPQNDALVVEAHIDPRDVDRIAAGQEATLRFTTFGQRTTPELDGKVEGVSPDVVVDPRTGAGYYAARIRLPADAASKLPHALVPGMPVEVFVATGSRTVLSFLVKPLEDQLMHTFRER